MTVPGSSLSRTLTRTPLALSSTQLSCSLEKEDFCQCTVTASSSTAGSGEARLARDHVARLLRHSGHGELADTARLLTSEIVTNAFAHTRVPFVTVETTIDAGRVLVAVYDACPPFPEPRAAVTDDETGRGLLLVELLAPRRRADKGQ
jgi:anti-sigma regulatory factor (Ser/Thr protein kinase)